MALNEWPLDANSVIQSVYDIDQNALRVNTQATVTAGALEVAIDATTDSIKIGDGTDFLAINPDGSINVNTVISHLTDSVLIYGWDGSANQKIKVDAAGELQIDVLSSALPSGASTSALQITGNTSLASIDSKIPSGLTVTSSRLLVDGSGVIQPVSAIDLDIRNLVFATDKVDVSGSSISASQSGVWNITNITGTVSLPTGAATSANQTTANTSLSSIDGKLNSLGQKVMTGSVPVVIASDQSSVSVSQSVSNQATYSASATFTAASSPTDVFTITGSGTKTIVIDKIMISGTNSGNTNALVQIIKRSTADSGGTSTTLTAVPLDSTDAAATAVVRSYTANPTLGTGVGTVSNKLIFLPTLASTNRALNEDFDYGISNNKGVYLQGTSEQLVVNFNGVGLGGTTTLNITIEWIEK